MKILCIGAGFAGAVIAREMAEAGHSVTVVDSRDHIAGNAFDYIDENGIRVHKYGPHIWHTNNDEAQEWFSKFTDWIPYKHYVKALLPNDDVVDLPITVDSVNSIFGTNFTEYDDAQTFINSRRVKCDNITNSRQHVESGVGKTVCDLLFAPYTKKMWGMELEELSASVAGRVPNEIARSSFYFPNDKYQGMPTNGYTAAFEKILSHPNIEVKLNTKIQSDTDFSEYDHVFNSMPIDVFFDGKFGELPYRSIKFHTKTTEPLNLPSPTINFTTKPKYTRVTEWQRYPGHGSNSEKTTLTAEEPCDYRDNNFERYYPIKDSSGEFRDRYSKYEEEAEKFPNMTFVGRMGKYQYLDMWMVICQSLKISRDFLAR